MRTNQKLGILILACTILLSFIYCWFIFKNVFESPLSLVGWISILFKIFIEICASFYGVSFFLIGLTYLLTKPAPQKPVPVKRNELPPVGLIFLCCNDIDENAIRSITKLKYEFDLHILVHDDSMDPASQAEVNDLVNTIRRKRPELNIEILRRTKKGGGKSAVVNYVLKETAGRYEYFILCDNDSTILDPYTIQKALDHFVEDKIAIVQFRTIGLESEEYCTANNYLIKCIDAFHVFMTVFSKYGWQPFIGHNAMLRTKPVLDAGGFTPGFFSDDLDMTIRLNLKGYKVRYGSNILMGEKPPSSYASFRKRSYKWAYGCMQSVKAHLITVVKSKVFSFAEKQTFLFFMGFYFMQGALLIYLVLAFLILPFFGFINHFNLDYSIVAGLIIIVTIFFPFISYFLKEKSVKNNLLSILIGGLTYGTTDFQSFRGIWDCILKRKREWVPTNQYGAQRSTGMFSEALFGVMLFMLPLLNSSSLLFLPSSYLFAGKFLFVPALYFFYDDRRKKVKSPKKKILFQFQRAVFILSFALFIPEIGLAKTGNESHANKTEIRGKYIYVNDKKFIVKGINYGPWRDSSGPNKNYNYPSASLISKDLTLIKDLHANTILVYDPPQYLLNLAEKNDLLVIYTFAINWWALGTPQFEKEQERILKKIEAFKQNPNILAWELGNEIPIELLQRINQDTIEKEMHNLYNSIKAIDRSHFIIHGNWPVTKKLRFNFFDMSGFNVYPVWPPEVVAHGYGNYISQVLQPIAGNKPLLITEFGVNSLEAGEDAQVKKTEQCWTELLEAGACGGVVFSFADEWWKNYDNPVNGDQLWIRKNAPSDELTHDLDPEEYYGLMTSERIAKPAYFAVAKMFKENSFETSQMIGPAVIVSVLILLALGAWIWARKSFFYKEHEEVRMQH